MGMMDDRFAALMEDGRQGLSATEKPPPRRAGGIGLRSAALRKLGRIGADHAFGQLVYVLAFLGHPLVLNAFDVAQVIGVFVATFGAALLGGIALGSSLMLGPPCLDCPQFAAAS